MLFVKPQNTHKTSIVRTACKHQSCVRCGKNEKLSIKHFSEVFSVAGFEYAYNNNFVYCNDCGLGFLVCEKEPKYEDDTHQALPMSKAVDMWNTRISFIESQGG